MYVWGVQVVQSSSALPYVRTTTIAVGTPRITHDPVTLVPLGLLMEPAATNLCLRSELFDNTTSWTADATTVTANSVAAPDNATTADLLLETTANDPHAVYQILTSSGSDNKCFSVFVKKQNRSQVFLQLVGAGTPNVRAGQLFDIDNGVKVGGILTSQSPTNTASGIESYGNGWYRVWVTAGNMAGNANPVIAISDQTGNNTPTYNSINLPTYTGNTANGIYVWGCQIEANADRPSSYIPTTTATVTRSGDQAGITSANLGFWSNTAGSIVMEGRFTAPSTTGLGFVRAGVAGSNQNMMMSQRFNVSNQPLMRVAGAISNSGPAGSTAIPTVGVLYKNGWNYTTTSFKGFVNGAAGSPVTLTSMFTTDTVEFLPTGANNISSALPAVAGSGILRRFRYWNSALSDSDMNTLTT